MATKKTVISGFFHSSVRRGAGLVGALILAALVGAWVQSGIAQASLPNTEQVLAFDTRLDQESALIRDSVSGLAGKLGELQARLIAMDAVRQRVAEAAGLSYTDPEIMQDVVWADTQVMDDISASIPPRDTAQALGRQLDVLQQRIAIQEDAYDMVDLALSRRAGIQASLPTYSPVAYPYLSSSFGWRRNPVTGRHSMHDGLDYAAPQGAPIRAASGGIVERAGYVSGYGRMVEIDHGNGIQTRYAHASTLTVKAGDLVRKGQLIAKVGSSGRSTGSHLHFEVRMAGYPLDPTLFLAPRLPNTSAPLVAAALPDAGGPQLR
ncbi:M23 family metallopeptidase [Alcaligenaceae bacterium CGII-47]|nr:M23 family metallopeptidase [Alcaligenaceae bacterium CGII-47]